MSRSRVDGISGVAGASALSGSTNPAPQSASEGVWRRSDGTSVKMADMNPYHRAAALKKAEANGDTAAADALRASGPLPE